jgi:uncharacterized protein with FMN-binding domain
MRPRKVRHSVRDKRASMKKLALSLLVIAASSAYLWDRTELGQAQDPLGSTLPTDHAQTRHPRRQISSPSVGQPTVSRPAKPAPADQLSGRSATGESITGTTFSINEPTSSAVPMPLQESLLEDAISLLPSPDLSSPPVDAPQAPLPSALAIDDVSLPRPRPTHRATQRQLADAMAVAAHAYVDGSYIGPAVDAYYGFVQIKAIVRGGRLVAVEVLEYPSDRRTSIFINRQALPMLRDEVVTAQSANVDIVSGATLTSEAFIRSLNAALRRAES